jgi:[ribosomal protein S5]-alanine N-acetyltransferase
MLAGMVKLERLRTDHEHALLEFERDNREYFARSISDRGDDFFAEFAARHHALLAEQDTGVCRYHVVVDDQGSLLGRVNLMNVQDTSADLGYRIAERAAGRGVATAAVEEVCRLAVTAYGLDTLNAMTTLENLASTAVLKRTGFAVVGDTRIHGRPAVRYQRILAV